ncbi:MAG: hypothetical protein JXB85_13225 [Anaerolineales bacterium]|nr:hypothetical protein [Anaerolineales bacterium]
MRVLKTLLASLATGYILVFYSEFVFYGQLSSPEQSPSSSVDLVLLGLIYSLLGYLLLAIVRRFGVRSLWALFLAGAAYGWLLEGVVVTSVYAEFPWQVPFTGLAWHAPLDVVVGWAWAQAALRRRSPLPSLGLSAGLGLFWGTWVLTWWYETGVPIPQADFSLFTLTATLVLVVAYWTLGRLSLGSWQPARSAVWAWGLFLLGWFGLTVLPVYPWAPLVLVPLLGVTFLTLRRNRQLETSPDLLLTLAERRPRLLNLASLLLVPLLASTVYASFLLLGRSIPVNMLVYILSSLLGIGLFAAAVLAILTLRKTPARGSPGEG